MDHITPVAFKWVIEDIDEVIIVNYTTGCPDGFSCTVCSTREDRPGFYERINQEWMCAHCAFNPNNDGKLIPV